MFGGGASGTFWFAGPPAAPDALLATCLLLTILSQSDRPLSEVLDAACRRGTKDDWNRTWASCPSS